jgi:hypothetical protein
VASVPTLLKLIVEYNVGILRSDKDSLYDDDGLIIFNALDWILSISLDRYSGML